MGGMAAAESLLATAADIGQQRQAVQAAKLKRAQRDELAAAEKARAQAAEKLLARINDTEAPLAQREAAIEGIERLKAADEAFNKAVQAAGGDLARLKAARESYEQAVQAASTVLDRPVVAAGAPAAARPEASPPHAALRTPEKVGSVTVARGMTVWEISQRTGVPVERILEFNKELGQTIDPTKLQVGQEIHVPLGDSDIQFQPKTAEEVRAMQRAALAARQQAAQAPRLHSPEVPMPLSPNEHARARALASLDNDRAAIREDEEQSKFSAIRWSTWVDTKDEKARYAARDAYGAAVDRFEAALRDPRSTDEQIRKAEHDKLRAMQEYNEARGVTDRAAVDGNYLTPVKELVQKGQDAVHGVTQQLADKIEESGAPPVVVAAATLPLHAAQAAADLDAGVIKGAVNLVDGLAGIVAHPIETAKGAAGLVDRYAQTTTEGQALEFLAEAAFGKYGSLDEAAQAWRQRSDPLKLVEAKVDLATDFGKAVFAESIKLAKEGKYSEAAGVLLGENLDVVLGAGILKGGRLGTVSRVIDGASDAQKLAGAAEKAGRVAEVTAEATRLTLPRQLTANLDDLYLHAAAAEEDLARATRTVAESANGRPVLPGLKGRERAAEKIASDYGGDASKVLDLARSSVVFDHADDVYRALDKLQEEFKVVRVKDRLTAPGPDGYRDVLVNLEMPNGHIVEMQLHLDSVLRVKDSVGHALYSEVREIEAAAVRANRPLTAAELQRIREATEQARRLYDQAATRAGAGSATAPGPAAGRTSVAGFDEILAPNSGISPGPPTGQVWAVPTPGGPKPRIGEPGAAEWRYQRYLHEQSANGKSPAEVLSRDEWVERYFNPTASGGRPGRSGGPEQVAAKRVLQDEGIRIVENVQLGGRYPDGIRPRPNAHGGTDYFEVGRMLDNGLPEARERVKLVDELRALHPKDTVTFVDRSNPVRRITYRVEDLARLLATLRRRQ